MTERIQHEPDAATRARIDADLDAARERLAKQHLRDGGHLYDCLLGACKVGCPLAGAGKVHDMQRGEPVTPAEAMQAATTVFDEPVKVAFGTWRKWHDMEQPFRVARFENDVMSWIRGVAGNKDSLFTNQRILEESRLASPHEVLTAFVATLPENQRARVHVGPSDLVGWASAIAVDGDVTYDIPGNDAPCDIDSVLAALREALAKPVASKPQTRTEQEAFIKQWSAEVRARIDAARAADKPAKRATCWTPDCGKECMGHGPTCEGCALKETFTAPTTPARSALVDGLESRIAELEQRNDELARENSALAKLQQIDADDVARLSRERDAFREALRVSEDDCERLHVRLNRLVGERKAAT